LFGLPAITTLNLIARVKIPFNSKGSAIEMYLKLFQGLTTLGNEQIPSCMLYTQQGESWFPCERKWSGMESLMISRIDGPSQWCAVVPKPSGK